VTTSCKFAEIDGHDSVWLDLGTHADMEDRRVLVRSYPSAEQTREPLPQWVNV